MEKTNEISTNKAAVNGLENLRSSYLERKSQMESEREAAVKGRENTIAEIAENEKKADELTKKHQQMSQRIDNQETQLNTIFAEIQELERDISGFTVDLNSKTSKKKMLEAMENDYEGFSRSVKAILKAPELKKCAIYGTVSGLITVEKEYVTAIEVALGGSLQNIVVESEQDAKSAISYLKENKLGRATFLPVSSVSGRRLDNINDIKKCDGFLGIASDIVRFDKKYIGVFESLLGRTVVVDNIDSGISMSRKFGYKFKIVTLSGEVLNAGGAISGGSVNKTSGFLSRASEIKTLSAEISKITSELEKLRAECKGKAEDRERISMQLQSYKTLDREYENDLIMLESSIRHLKASVETDSSDSVYNDEYARISKQLAESADEIAKLISLVRTDENLVEALNKEAQSLSDEYVRIEKSKEEKSQQLLDETLNLRSMENDIQSKKALIEEIKKNIAENNRTIEQKVNDKADISKQNEDYENSIKEKNILIEEIREKSKEIKEHLAQIEKDKAVVLEKLKGMQNSNKELTDRMILLQQELARVENKETKLVMERDNLISRLWDEYELTTETAPEIKRDIENEKEAVENCSKLRSRIKALGSINIDSIEEYRNVKERFEFLSEQKNDLEKSKDNLLKVISSMQELMEEHFIKQFEQINKSFENVFRELFGGGHGRLYLHEPDNVLESGIEIEVQLPGKSLQNINLYSGGEKSFIAIALLFAILAVKPTPFCILDEIDAALDDVNVSRFATYIKNYLDDTQFIVITHRRGTMEAANVLYGVTMQEKGVTKMLSLAIDEVDQDLIK